MTRFSVQSAFVLLLFLFWCPLVFAQKSIAREWNEALIQSMEEDLARPHVQARTIFHFAIAMYDAWAAFDEEADTYLLGKTINGYHCPCNEIPKPADIEAARKEAMSFAAYRLLSARFTHSPQSTAALFRFREIMKSHGYEFQNHSIDYASGSPAAFGNYLAQCVLQMGKNDGANEEHNYQNQYYRPVNSPLKITASGTGDLADPNQWQPLKLNKAIDHDGYPVMECRCMGKPFASMIDSVDKDGRVRFTGTQSFQGAQWGRVWPFALKKEDRKTFRSSMRESVIYHPPGNFFPRLDTLKASGTSAEFQWNYALVAAWSGLLSPNDTTLWDISPGNMGNVQQYPENLAALPEFFDLQTGRDPGQGHPLNPCTGLPYPPHVVPRGDFLRAAVQYWAEGPNAETPPGHWLGLLNYVSDQPELVKKFNGKGTPMGDLEWDVKSCFVLGAALHDAAIAGWGVKGWYNSARPITAIRYLASRGQCTDPNLPSYHPAGIPLLPGRIELVSEGDSLAGPDNAHLNKIKIFAWKGPFAVDSPATQTAGVGWILAENWFPYQPKTFITPPYGGFVSGHAVLSHAAAETLARLTGDNYFPGGIGFFTVAPNNQFLRIEKGPSVEVTLQWATYRDAADQAGISRIWAGANTPFDDIAGRIIGVKTGEEAFSLAKTYFYKDRDQDGFLSFEDCDDDNPAVYPGASEGCKENSTDTPPPCRQGNR